MPADLEADVAALVGQITELSERHRSRLASASWWNDRMLDWAISHPSFKTQLFRFVDVFPATTDDEDVVRHLEEYFREAEVPHAFDLGLELAERVPFGPALSARVARRNIARLAGRFIVGTGPAGALDNLHALWRKGSAFTVDLLGEKTVDNADADRYARRLDEMVAQLVAGSAAWAPDDLLERDDIGPLARVNVSVKPTALSAHFAPLSREEGVAEVLARLRPVLARAARGRAHVHLDMEHYDVKDVTLELLEHLATDPELAPLQLGVVVQAYLKDSYADLRDIVELSRRRTGTALSGAGAGTPLTVRLVRGAYWDAETIQARAEGWPVPVFDAKEHTDANYERCTRLLHENHGSVRAAFGTHNLRSTAYAIASARVAGIPDSGYEIQMLYGMATPIHAALRQLGLRLRVYAPVGELVPGMAYLVRRLLENTSNESFLRQRASPPSTGTEPVRARPSAPVAVPGPDPVATRPPTDPGFPGPYRHEPHAEWRRRPVRDGARRALDHVAAGLGFDVPAWIDGHEEATSTVIDSVDPSCPRRLVARSASCGDDHTEHAVAVAERAWPAWRDTRAEARAAVLFGAAAWMRARRAELAGLEVYEAGKPWADADADVCEAIDFLEYYGRRMVELAKGAPVESPPGESNTMRYTGRGVGAVIAPWNFPLAIPTGMVAAALVTGNAVVFKPAEQTPGTAWRLVEALRAGGLPDGVLGFLPGPGEVVGAKLVRHPKVAFVAFTGSKAVGLDIVEQAGVQRPGQRDVKRVVVEMGGKNAIVVDGDADLDQAVPIVVASAFGYSGQKCSACSRLVAVGGVHDELVARVAGAAAGLRIGHPAAMGVDMGPLIDAEAQARVRAYARMASDEGDVVLDSPEVPADGYFVGPTIVTGVAPDARVATDEIFGPVLAVLRADTIGDAIAIANHTDYALTAGIVSRSPAHIELATRRLRAGNIYVNRAITGAVVGRQPFGGYGLSGVGSKAGGPDYLLQFLEPVAVSENTVRQGFAPAE
ncbi:MAG TPA: proline dehydrogenase family protein [Acidimicrobiales bacterium]|nr:proline dehydrogenase family protein [Acidimicrobiales bacterium]